MFCSLLVVCCSFNVVCCLLFEVCWFGDDADCMLCVIVRCWLIVVCRLWFGACCSLRIGRCSVLVVRRLLSDVCLLGVCCVLIFFAGPSLS